MWRFKAFDVLTGAFLTDVPVVSWSGTDPLAAGSVGEFTAEVLLDSKAAGVKTVIGSTGPVEISTGRRRVIANALATEPAGRTILVAVRNGAVMQPSGIVWDWDYSTDKPGVLTIKGRALLSFFLGFYQRAHTLVYAATDQLDIFRSLVSTCRTTNTNAAIPLTVHTETSGVLRDRTYRAADNRQVGDLLIELSQVQNGFEFDIRPELNGDQIENHLRLWFPRRGKSVVTHADLLPRFRATRGGNATMFGVSSGSGGFEFPAAQVFAIGAGDGLDSLVRPAVSTELIAGGWPGYSTSRSYKDVTEQATLQAHAAHDVARLSMVDAAEFVVTINPDAASTRWGSWDLGDDAWLIIDDEPLYPRQDDGSPGAVKQRRVTQHRVSVNTSGERFEVALGRTA